jgi:hypothetical protein
MDTCNVLLDRALNVFGGPGGINDRLATMPVSQPIPTIGTLLKLSAPIDVYEKAASVKYPVASIYCERLRNLQTEKFRTFSGSALLVVEIRVSGARAEDLDSILHTYVEAACQVLEGARGPWTGIGTYTGSYDVKFQAMRPGGKQFTKSAHIEFDIQISR